MADAGRFDAYDCSRFLQLRRRYWRSTAGFFAGWTIGAVASIVPWQIVAGVLFAIGFTIGGVSWFVAVIAWFKILAWRCPRCKGIFVWAWYSTWPTSRCKHCDLSAFGDE